MGVVVLKLVLSCLSLTPIAALIAVRWRRWAPSSPASEAALASALGSVVVIIAEVVGLGVLPLDRPLRALVWLHLGLCAAAMFGLARRRREAIEIVRESWAGFLSAWRGALWPLRVLLLAIPGQFALIVLGLFRSPWAADHLAYHLPQTLQLWQDQKLGRVMANVDWADSYPRGCAFVVFWFMQFCGSDAAGHFVQGLSGFVFMLAAYAAGRRAGLSRGWAVSAAMLPATAPAWALLSISGYIDVASGALVAAMIAFSLPRADGKWDWPSAVGMLTAAMIAMLFKLVAAPMVAVILGLRGVIALSAWAPAKWRSRWPDQGPRAWSLLAAGVVFMGVAFVPYAKTWRDYGSPSHPVQIKVGSRVITDGWMTMEDIQFNTTHSKPERYAKFWTDFWEPKGIDSPGGFGPMFALLMLPMTLIAMVAAVRTRAVGLLILAVSFWVVVLVPGYQSPRYSLHMLMPGAVCTAAVLSRVPGLGWNLGGAVLTLALVLWNAVPTVFSLRDDIRYRRGQGADWSNVVRDRELILRHVRVTKDDPPYEALKALHAAVKPGETAVTAVIGYMPLLYDAAYSYRVEHRPAKPWPPRFTPWLQPDFGTAEIPAWLDGLRRERVGAVMVYRGTAEDRALREPGRGYRLVGEYPTGQGDHALVLFGKGE